MVRKSDRLTFARGCTIPVPGTIGGFALLTRVNLSATTSWLAPGWALIASTTCAPVLEGWLAASVPS